MNDNNYKFISTPLWVYVLATFIVAINFVVSFFLNDSIVWLKELLKNLGYGIATSTIVSLLIDFGATKRKKDQDDLTFSIMVAELKNECAELPSEMYTSVYEAYGYEDDGKYTFAEWTTKLLSIKGNSTQGKQEREIKYIIQTISEIKKGACELVEVMKLSLVNEHITIEYIDTIKQIIFCCQRIERAAKDGAYGLCKDIILNELKDKVTKAFPELSSEYNRKYNEQDYM